MKKFLIGLLTCLAVAFCSLGLACGGTGDSSSSSSSGSSEQSSMEQGTEGSSSSGGLDDSSDKKDDSSDGSSDSSNVVQHTHVYNQEVAETKYLRTVATCTSKAVYYKSCKCGEIGAETFEYGDYYHAYNQENTADKYLKSAADCTHKAVYYKSCECGKKSTATFEFGETLGHDFTDYFYNNNATYEQDGTKRASCNREGCYEEDVISVKNTRLNLIKFSLGKSKNENYYALTVSPLVDDVTLTYQHFSVIEEKIEYADGVELGGLSYAEYKQYIDTVHIAEGITKIESMNVNDYCNALSIYLSNDVEELGPRFIGGGTFYSLSVYFAGDMPVFQPEKGAWNGSGTTVFYYQAGAKGFVDGIHFDNFYACRLVDEEMVYPNITIAEYADLSHQRAKEMATDMFETIVKNDSVPQMLYPIAQLSNYQTIKNFAIDLTKGCSTELEKTRVIFDWLVDNIEYDMDALFYTCEQIFETRRAVCGGYTFLMHDMLAGVGIMSEVVSGICHIPNSTTIKDVFQQSLWGTNLDSHHAWLVAYVDGKTMFFDPTWNEFDINSATVQGDIRVSFAVGLNTIVPDGMDYRLYDTGIFDFNGESYYLRDGTVVHTSGYGVIHNFVYQINLRFCDTNEGYGYVGNIEPKLGAAYRDGAARLLHNNEYIFYFMPNGYERQYVDMLRFIFMENATYGHNYTLYGMENYYFQDDIIYMFQDDGTATVIVSYSTATEIVIPEEVDGKRVVKIGYRSFRDNATLQKIVLPSGVQVIDQCAFQNCANLQEVVFGEGLQTIESSAFEKTGIIALVLPESVYKIEQTAFQDCKKLETAYLGASVREFYGNSFIGCTALSAYTVSTQNTTYSSADGVIFDKAQTKLISYPMGNTRKSYTVPKTVVEIAACGFEYAQVEEVILPENLVLLGERAFSVCKNLKSIAIPKGVKRLEQQTFSYAYALEKVEFLGAVEYMGNECFSWCTSLKEIVLPEGLKIIDNSAFIACSGLEKITLPSTLEVINLQAFWDCQSLRFVEYNGKESEKPVILESNGDLQNATWTYKE